jgi:hypothetical protein
MKNKLLILLLILSNPIYSQSKFQLQLSGNGSEQGVAIVENAAGNFVILSSTVTGSNIDMIISEISASGIWIKSKKIGTSNGETPLSICTTSDGNYIIGGSYNVSFSDYDWIVAKIDTGFNIVWLKHLGWTGGNDYANSIQEISPGRYGISGTLGLNGSAKPSFVIMDDLGNISQEFHLNTNQFASPAYKAKYFNDGTFGYIHLKNILCTMDTNGVVLNNLANNMGIFTTDILKNSAKGYTILVSTDYGSLQGGTTGVCVYDSALTTTSILKKYRLTGSDITPINILQDNAGNYLVAANIVSLGSGNSNALVFKIDSTGSILWAKKYSPNGTDQSSVNNLIATSDGGYAFTGFVGTGATIYSYVVKLDSNGNSACSSTSVTLTTSSGSLQSVTAHSISPGTTQVLSTLNPTLTALTLIPLVCTNVGIEEIEIRNSMVIYPNPTNTEINVSFDEQEETYINIYSLTGQMVKKALYNKNEKIDISNLARSTYFLTITNKNNNILHRSKFIKE